MLKALLTYLYDEDEFALYVPDWPHWLPPCRQSCELAALTQRSLLPVSMCRRKFCAGVPKLALAK
jgi:hypothetical protein